MKPKAKKDKTEKHSVKKALKKKEDKEGKKESQGIPDIDFKKLLGCG